MALKKTITRLAHPEPGLIEAMLAETEKEKEKPLALSRGTGPAA